jgi:hypothetical protein
MRPRTPYLRGPASGTHGIDVCVVAVGQVKDCDVAGLGARSQRDGVAGAERFGRALEQHANFAVVKIVLKPRTQAHQVEDRRPTRPRVAAVAGVLRHVAVDHHPMGEGAAPPPQFIGLQLGECRPASRDSRDIAVRGSVDDRYFGATLVTDHHLPF